MCAQCRIRDALDLKLAHQRRAFPPLRDGRLRAALKRISHLLLGAEMTDDLICEHEANHKAADVLAQRLCISRLIISLNGSAKNQRVDTIGKRVRALRKAAGLTQAELAKRLGVEISTQAGLSMLEAGKTERPSARVLAGLCRVLGTTPDYILEGSTTGLQPLSEEAVQWARLYEALSPGERQKLRLLYNVARDGKNPDAKTWTAPQDASQPSEGMHGMDSGLGAFHDDPVPLKTVKRGKK